MAQPRELQSTICLYWCPDALNLATELSILDDLNEGKLPILVTNLECSVFQEFLDRKDVGRIVVISTGSTGLVAKISDRICYDIKPLWSWGTKLGVAEAVRIFTGWSDAAEGILEYNRTLFDEMDVESGPASLAHGAPSKLKTLNMRLTD